LTDQTWTVLHHNEALDAWSGGWYTAADAADRHLVAYLPEQGAPALTAVTRIRLLPFAAPG
jgi:hypothetical protein